MRFSTRVTTIVDEILRLRDMRKQAEVDTVVKDEQMRLIQDLQDFIKAQPTTITEFDRSNRSNVAISPTGQFFGFEEKCPVAP